MPKPEIRPEVLASAETMVSKFIANNQITAYQINHLTSKITIECVAYNVDSVQNLSQQVTVTRLKEVIKLDKQIDDELGVSFEINDEYMQYLQQYLDELNSMRIEIQQLISPVEFTPSMLALYQHRVRIYGAFLGLSIAQMQNNFSYRHIEAICRGYQFELIATWSEEDVKLLLTGAALQEIVNPLRGPIQTRLAFLGLPLNMSLASQLDELTLELILKNILANCKLVNYANIPGFYASKATFNVKNHFTNILEIIDNCDGFNSLSLEQKFRVISGVPDYLIKERRFSDYQTLLYAGGIALNKCLSLTKYEAKSISMGLTPLEAIESQFPAVALNIIQDTMPVERVSESEIYERLQGLSGYQIEIFRCVTDDKVLISLQIEFGHVVSYWMVEDDVSEEYWIKCFTTQSGMIVGGAAFGLTAEQASQPWFGLFHLQTLLSLYNSQPSQQDYIAKYSEFKGLNGAQLYSITAGSVRNQVCENFLPKEYYLALAKNPNAKLNDLALYQLEGIALGLSLAQVRQPWYIPEHNIVLKKFPLLFKFEDLNPYKIESLARRYNLPDELAGWPPLTWAHILTYLRLNGLINMKTLLDQLMLLKKPEQALGIGLGLHITQLNNDWFSALHAELIFASDAEFARHYRYADVAELTETQLLGLKHGLFREDVTSDWFSVYHMVAMSLGYNPMSVRGATVQQVKTIIASCYTCDVNLDQYIARYYPNCVTTPIAAINTLPQFTVADCRSLQELMEANEVRVFEEVLKLQSKATNSELKKQLRQ